MAESVKVGMTGSTDHFKKRMGNKACRNKENLAAHMHTLFGRGSSSKPTGTLKGICGDFENSHFSARYCAIKAALTSNLGKFDVRAVFIAQ